MGNGSLNELISILAHVRMLLGAQQYEATGRQSLESWVKDDTLVLWYQLKPKPNIVQ